MALMALLRAPKPTNTHTRTHTHTHPRVCAHTHTHTDTHTCKKTLYVLHLLAVTVHGAGGMFTPSPCPCPRTAVFQALLPCEAWCWIFMTWFITCVTRMCDMDESCTWMICGDMHVRHECDQFSFTHVHVMSHIYMFLTWLIACVMWLTHMCGITCTHLVYMYDISHSVWHDPCIYMIPMRAYHIQMWHVTHPCVTHNPWMPLGRGYSLLSCRQICGMTHAYCRHPWYIRVGHVTNMYIVWNINISCESHSSHIYM